MVAMHDPLLLILLLLLRLLPLNMFSVLRRSLYVGCFFCDGTVHTLQVTKMEFHELTLFSELSFEGTLHPNSPKFLATYAS